MVSGVTGGRRRAAELCSPQYWVRQVREAVLFAEGIRAWTARGCHPFLSSGPTRYWSPLTQRMPPGARGPARPRCARIPAPRTAPSRGLPLPRSRPCAPTGLDGPLFSTGRAPRTTCHLRLPARAYWPSDRPRRRRASRAGPRRRPVTRCWARWSPARTPTRRVHRPALPAHPPLAGRPRCHGHRPAARHGPRRTGPARRGARRLPRAGRTDPPGPAGAARTGRGTGPVAVAAARRMPVRRPFAVFSGRDLEAKSRGCGTPKGAADGRPLPPARTGGAQSPPAGAEPMPAGGRVQVLVRRGSRVTGRLFQGLRAAWRRGDEALRRAGTARCSGDRRERLRAAPGPARLGPARPSGLGDAPSGSEEEGARLPFAWSGVRLHATGASRGTGAAGPGRSATRCRWSSRTRPRANPSLPCGLAGRCAPFPPSRSVRRARMVGRIRCRDRLDRGPGRPFGAGSAGRAVLGAGLPDCERPSAYSRPGCLICNGRG